MYGRGKQAAENNGVIGGVMELLIKIGEGMMMVSLGMLALSVLVCVCGFALATLGHFWGL